MIIFDGHNDTLTRLYEARQPLHLFFGCSESGHVDLPRALEGGMRSGFFAIFTSPPPESPERDPMYGLTFTDDGGYNLSERSPIPQEYAQHYTDAVLDYANQLEAESDGALQIVRTVAALERCLDGDALGIVLQLEGAEAIRPDLSNLETYTARGVRSIGPVWSRPNAFGHGVPFRFPHAPDTGPGLTDAGKALIKACNDLGILLDLSHLNERGFFDVAELTSAPLVVSHADVYAICPSTRNLTDAQIDAIGASHGVIGVNFETLNTHPQASIEQDVPLTQITQHIDYIVQRIGVEHVAFGSDFDGADLPNDLRDASMLPNLIEALRAGGYDQDAIEKMAYQNWLRVISETWG